MNFAHQKAQLTALMVIQTVQYKKVLIKIVSFDPFEFDPLTFFKRIYFINYL